MKHDDADPARPSEDEVRRLLAGLRDTAATPDDVVDRLGARLATLQDERRHEAAEAPPPRPAGLVARRRRVRVLLATAAAVLVAAGAGGVVVQVLDDGSLTAAGESASTAQSGSRAEDPRAQDPRAQEPRTQDPGGAATSQASDLLPRLSRADFVAEVEAVLAGRSAARSLVEDDALADSLPRTPGCEAGVAPTGRQRSFVARLDGERVLVLVGARTAAAYACGVVAADRPPGPPPGPVITRSLD